MSEDDKPRGINILCIDGGGVRGLSSLVLLGEIMGRLGELEGRYERPDPAEHFDVIAGTGTGGIIACMLGRLRMPLNQALSAYVKLVSEVFSDKKVTGTRTTTVDKSTRLREALKSLIHDSAGDEGERMKQATKDLPKTIVFAMSRQNVNAASPVMFRSYESARNAAPNCTIWEALYATMAHPDLFKSIDIRDGPIPLSFVGGEIGCSNPIAHILSEVANVYPGRRVSCVLSIGAGRARTISLPDSLLSPRRMSTQQVMAMKDIATDSERVAEEMAARFRDTTGVYYRFNVDQGMQDMNADDWEKLGEVMAHTRSYIGKVEPNRGIDQAAQIIKNRKPRILVKHLDGRAQAIPEEQAVGLKRCPAPSSVFTGRESQIQQIAACIVGSIDERRVCVVHGLGGAGKTQLALKTIERHRDHWTHVLYVDASSRENIETTLQDVGKAKDIGRSHEDTLGWLESCREAWVLVYDNADDPSLPIHEYFPGGDRGSILITTRLSDMQVHAKGPGSDCRVSQMNHEDALVLLLRLARIQKQTLGGSEIVAANTLLEDIGHFALAIIQAGAYIGHCQMTLSKYRDLFLARRLKTLEQYAKLKVKVDSYQWSVFTTWKLCYDLLEESGASRPLLWLIAYMHHDRITEGIFKRAAIDIQHYEPDLPTTDVEKTACDYVRALLSRFLDEDGDWDTSSFTDAISELASYSLIDYDRVNAEYRIHVLVQEWARTIIPQPANLALECTTTLLARAVDKAETSQAYRSRLDLGLHIIKVLSEQGDAVCVNHIPRFANLCGEKGLWDRKEGLETRLKEARERALGAEHQATLLSMGYLAWTYMTQDRFREAEQLQLKVLDALGRTLGEDHPDAWTSMGNLAATYSEQGRWNEAEQIQVKVMEAHERILGEEDSRTLANKSNLASTYSKQGRLNEAERLEAKVLGAHRRRIGQDHPTTLTSMNRLASMYLKQGRWDEAEGLYLGVLDARSRTLGEEHPDTWRGMGNLAAAYSEQGRWNESEKLRMEVLNAHKRTLGESHPDTLESMSKLASVYSKQGRWNEAEQLQGTLLGARRRILGEEHPATLEGMSNLAYTYSEQGRWNEAEQLQAQVLDACRRTLGEEHPDTLSCMNSLALKYLEQGRCDEAEELQVKVLDARRRTVGEEHPDTLASIDSLAETFWNQSRWDEAEQLQLEVLNAYSQKLAEEHPDILRNMANLAATYFEQRRWNEAEQLQLKVLNAYRRALGEDHWNTVRTMGNLAATYSEQGRWDEAEQLQVQVLEVSGRTLGEEYPYTLIGMNNLAMTRWKQGQRNAAQQLYVKVLDARKRILGEEHPYTLASMNNLALIYLYQGRSGEAEQMLLQVLELRGRIIGDQHPDTVMTRESLAALKTNTSDGGTDD